MNEISIIGAGGHAKVIIELAEELDYSILNVFDQNIKKSYILSYKVSHNFFCIPKNTIVAIGDNSLRKKVSQENILEVSPLIHPKSTISRSADIDDGTVVMAGVSINSDVVIGRHCIINTNSSIDHDCIIGDYVHISPNVALAGNVVVGEGTHIGIGACVIQGVKIGKWCTIGAGAVVIKDVFDFQTVVGNPAKVLDKSDK
ncbi:acetyltransferase [Pseudopedobacter sp.]|uniref:acetyltransferase n=1 Tax=Pseudopedobacter sp. TaxID=1936787 RepID=UPI00333FE122